MEANSTTVTFQSERDGNVYVGEKPTLLMDKMDLDCIRCTNCHSNKDGFFCLLDGENWCEFESIF